MIPTKLKIQSTTRGHQRTHTTRKMAFKKGALVAFLLVVAAAEMFGGASAVTYVVGDSMGWMVPPPAASYATWAAQHVFVVGDVLVFNYTTGFHDVARVTSAAYTGCSSNNPIALATLGPSSFTLNSTGMDYYICTFGQHCSLGQRLAINVTSASSATPTPAPASPPMASPPSPPMATTPSPSPTSTPPMVPSPTPPMVPSPTPSMGPSPTPSMGPSPTPSPGSAMSPGPTGSGSGPSPSMGGAPGEGPGPNSGANGDTPAGPGSSAMRTALATPLAVIVSLAFVLVM